MQNKRSKAETYQGAPCKRGHVNAEGKTVRYAKNGHCIECKRIVQQQYHARPEIREAVSEYYKAYAQQPEQQDWRRTYEKSYRGPYLERPDVKARTKKYYRAYDIYRKYGLTMADYDAMFIAQEGRCPICSRPLDDPHVDHDHKTGKVRAILCEGCNVGLGAFRDNPEACVKAAEYLRRHSSAS